MAFNTKYDKRSKLYGVAKVNEILSAQITKAKTESTARYTVEFTAPYAIYQHENLEYKHPNGGQAKYLEQPAKARQQELGQITLAELKATGSMRKALLKAAQSLLGWAKELVPVDTGFLKKSGKVRKVS